MNILEQTVRFKRTDFVNVANRLKYMQGREILLKFKDGNLIIETELAGTYPINTYKPLAIQGLEQTWEE